MAVEGRPRVGFIGLGNMGSRIAHRLLDAGYPLTVYNRTREKTAPFAQRGAAVAATPQELARSSQAVITCVADDAAVKSVMFDQQGALAGSRPGTIFIDLSTVYPKTSRQVFEAAQAKGASMLDVALSGSTSEAEQGDLVVFVGGQQDAYETVRPLLNVFSRRALYMGPSGAGAIMKLVANTLLGLGLQALAEAIALGEKAGLDRERLLGALAETPAMAPAHKPKLENVRSGAYPVAFAMRLMDKDFGLILREAQALDVPMPATAVAEQMCAVEQARGIEEDYSATIRLMERLAGLPEVERRPALEPTMA